MAAPGSFRNVCPGPRATPSATNLPSVPGKDGLDRAALVGVGWEYMVAFAAANGNPSNHKWFRNLAISEIVADTMEDMDLKLPPTQVDIAEIWRKYHAVAEEQARRDHKPPKA